MFGDTIMREERDRVWLCATGAQGRDALVGFDHRHWRQWMRLVVLAAEEDGTRVIEQMVGEDVLLTCVGERTVTISHWIPTCYGVPRRWRCIECDRTALLELIRQRSFPLLASTHRRSLAEHSWDART